MVCNLPETHIPFHRHPKGQWTLIWKLNGYIKDFGSTLEKMLILRLLLWQKIFSGLLFTLLIYILFNIKYLTFQCSLCDNSFCQQANLDRHVRKHQEQSTTGTTYKGEHMSDDDDEDEDFVELVDL